MRARVQDNILCTNFIGKINMDVTDVDNLKRSLTAGRWPGCIRGLNRRKFNRILGHVWKITKTKNS